MKNFLENDTAEEYERLRHTIGQPDYDSLPTSPHQPIPEEELLQVAQPLNLGDEHQGEANYDALVEQSAEEDDDECEAASRGEEREGSGNEEELGMPDEGEAAEGNTRGSKTLPGSKESVKREESLSGSDGGNATDAEEEKDVDNNPPQSSSPTKGDADKALNHLSDSQGDFDWFPQRQEGRKDKEKEVSPQRETVAQGRGEDDEKGLSIQSSNPQEYQQSSPRIVKRYEAEGEPAVQVDLEGNLTAATRMVLQIRDSNKAKLGEVQKVNNPEDLHEFSGVLDAGIAVDIASFPHSPSQCPMVTLNEAVGNILEPQSSNPCGGEASFEVDDFFISSPEKPAERPLSLPTSLPLAAPLNSLQQRIEPPSSLPPRGSSPQEGLVCPRTHSLRGVPYTPTVAVAQHPLAGNPSAPVILRVEQRATPNVEGAPKPNSGKTLGARNPPMKGKASKERARKTCATVAHRMSEATGGKPIFMQNGRRVRIVKPPRPTASNILPSRPPRYPTQLPSAEQPSPALPVPPLPPQGLEALQQNLLVRRRQAGSAAGHAELLRLLDAFNNLPHRPANSDGKVWGIATSVDLNQVSAASNSAMIASGPAITTMHANGCPGRYQASQGSGVEDVAASPLVQSSTARKSVKRKLELTAEERQEKKRIRAMRNRQSAEKSRRRRKEYTTALEANVQILREQSQEWRRRYVSGLRRLSEIQRDIRALSGQSHEDDIPVVQDVVDVVRDMVARCPYSFKRKEPEIELRHLGEDGRRDGRGRGARGRARGASRSGPGNRGGRGG